MDKSTSPIFTIGPKRMVASLAIILALTMGTTVFAADISRLAIPAGPVTQIAPDRLALRQAMSPSRIDPSLAGAQGTVEVWVKLSSPSVAAVNGDNAKTRGAFLSKEQRNAHKESLDRGHDELAAAARSLGGRELGRVTQAHNAIAVSIDASRLAELAARPGVDQIRPVIHYELMLSETVPYIGAAAAQAAGKDGTGARVAVLDSGIDYTHRNLGGPGTTDAYETAVATYPNPYFPSAKVVGGYDFTGSEWPNGPRTEDPNPIDDGAGGGHGTHVADIIGGRSQDGLHKGVAPGAQLYAVKVCSSVSSSCNGVALLKAVDFALDPKGDGSFDSVDVINLSLGSNYGMKEDDLSEALNRASAAGIVVVAAAGNAANRPYIVSSPSTAPPVISVAQTQVPSAKAYPLVVNSPATIAGTYANTETVEWAPVSGTVTGDVAFVGRGCPAGSINGSNPDDTYLASPAGKVALIDRGACSVSLKVDRAAKAGATAVLIGLVAAGDAVSFSFGGGDTFVPTLVIIRADANRIKANIAVPVNVTVSAANSIPLVGSMVGSSARGPSISYQTIKPEIGAPGASVSAVYGTGTGQIGFGGTSGATPMIAGSAAILIGANPKLEPAQVKALLMNNAETQVFHNPALAPGKLAPITRIGSGEVRVNKALAARSAAWVEKDQSAAISFGYRATGRTTEISREVRVENYDKKAKTFQISSAFRVPAKGATGAVEIRTPRSVRVGGRSAETFEVSVVVHPEHLPVWNIDGGLNGGNGDLLDGLEFDGYVTLMSGSEKLTLPWHVLPHKAADLDADHSVRVGKTLEIKNDGAADGWVEVFSLTGTSPEIPKSALPKPGDNFAVIDLESFGVRVVPCGTPTNPQDCLQFGISTHGGRAHPNYPAEFDVYIDTNNDGVPDFVVYNAENGGFGATGQNLVFVVDLATGAGGAYFYNDADLNSSNAIFTVPMAALGVTADATLGLSVYAYDNYFTGIQTDAIEGMVYTPSKPRFAATDLPAAGIAPHAKVKLTVTAPAGGAAASPSQTGFLLQYRDSDVKNESQAVVVRP
jgi:subtilisin family serine protease